VVNGSFEQTPAGSTWTLYLAGSDLGGWRVENGTVEAVGTFWQAAEGSTSIDLSGIFSEIGTIGQDIPTEPGRAYRLSFSMSGNPDSQIDYLKRMRVWWNAAELATLDFDVRGYSVADMGWRRYEYLVTASQSTTRLQFQSLTENFLGPVLDDVRLEPNDTSEGTVLEGRLCFSLTISGEVGRTYAVESKDAEGHPWESVTNVVLATSPMSWVDHRGAQSRHRFYRVRLVP
jgi:choice-of-anchor C domain-containing protein